MADDDAVIKLRLLTRTSAIGKSGIKRCADAMISFLHAVSDPKSNAKKSKHELDNMLWELEQTEVEARKMEIFGYTCEKEITEYDDLHKKIDASIEKASKDIKDLKSAVRKEKIIKGYKEEYEAIARIMNTFPSQESMTKAIQEKEQRLVEENDMLRKADAKLDGRMKQFHLLLSTIQNLKAELNEDAALEELEYGKNDGDKGAASVQEMLGMTE